jgi:hypothetical protein
MAELSARITPAQYRVLMQQPPARQRDTPPPVSRPGPLSTGPLPVWQPCRGPHAWERACGGWRCPACGVFLAQWLGYLVSTTDLPA